MADSRPSSTSTGCPRDWMFSARGPVNPPPEDPV